MYTNSLNSGGYISSYLAAIKRAAVPKSNTQIDFIVIFDEELEKIPNNWKLCRETDINDRNLNDCETNDWIKIY